MHVVNFWAIIIATLAAALFAQQASAPVLVEKEPLHHLVLQNDSIHVMHLVLPPGEWTLFHTHSTDRVAIFLSDATTTQQEPGKPETEPRSNVAGQFAAMTLEGNSYTHRVHNVGSTPFDVIDVEILHRPAAPSEPAVPVSAENPRARIYNWPLAPGASSSMHAHTRPYLLVAAKPILLKMTSPDGQSMSHQVSAGEFHWVDSKVTHTLTNAGSSPGQLVEIELK